METLGPPAHVASAADSIPREKLCGCRRALAPMEGMSDVKLCVYAYRDTSDVGAHAVAAGNASTGSTNKDNELNFVESEALALPPEHAQHPSGTTAGTQTMQESAHAVQDRSAENQAGKSDARMLHNERPLPCKSGGESRELEGVHNLVSRLSFVRDSLVNTERTQPPANHLEGLDVARGVGGRIGVIRGVHVEHVGVAETLGGLLLAVGGLVQGELGGDSEAAHRWEGC